MYFVLEKLEKKNNENDIHACLQMWLSIRKKKTVGETHRYLLL